MTASVAQPVSSRFWEETTFQRQGAPLLGPRLPCEPHGSSSSPSRASVPSVFRIVMQVGREQGESSPLCVRRPQTCDVCGRRGTALLAGRP